MMRPLVLRLGYVALNVVDLQGVCEDTANIAGARVVDQTNDRIMMSSNERHAELILYKSHENRAHCIGLEVNHIDAVDQIKARVEKAGLQLLSDKPSLPCIEKGVTFATSEGHVFEAHTPMPRDRSHRYWGGGAHPNFMDHVNLSAGDPKKISEEMHAAVGLQLVERTKGYEILWMRASDNRHHTIAATRGEPGGVHHISWDFPSFENFKVIADMTDVNDRTLVWGPGRHGAGDNLFTYYLDRADFLIECSAEMISIHEEEFTPRVYEPGEGLSNLKVVNRWGSAPPELWLKHYNAFAKFSKK